MLIPLVYPVDVPDVPNGGERALGVGTVIESHGPLQSCRDTAIVGADALPVFACAYPRGVDVDELDSLRLKPLTTTGSFVSESRTCTSSTVGPISVLKPEC